MENKINIAEILKDCPKGMELDCLMCDNCTFDGIEEYLYPIKVQTPDGQISLNKYGCYSNNKHAKCVIFPKGKTTWEGFVPPCEFKDGDVVAGENCVCSYITIFRKFIDDTSFSHHVCLTSFGNFKVDDFSDIANLRLATEEEKQKLFDAIKANGYKWNPYTKTLERLIEPKFKVGNVIQDKGGYKVRITNVSIEDECYGYESLTVNGIGGISFNRQDKWELVPNKFDITTLVPFESRVLVRHNKDNKWCGSFFSHIDKDLHSNCYKFVTIAGKSYPMMIPYEGNEHLLGTTDDCNEFYKNWE